MSHHHIEVTEDIWFVAYTEERGVVHYGFAPTDSTVTSGQHDFETFSTEEAMAARVDELKGITGWYEANKPAEAPNDPAGNVT